MAGNADIESYKVAFAVHFMQLIMASDGVLDYGELVYFTEQFPEKDLRERGFLDESGRMTEAFHDARILGALTLPDALDLGEKLDLLVSLHRLALSDGALAVREYETLCACADKLGVSREALSGRLDQERWRS